MRADEVAGPAVEAYLAEVAARLGASRRARDRIVDELRDGLLTAARAHREHGLTVAESEATAVGEFGPPQLLARLFADELAYRRAGGIGRTYLITGPLVGAGWLALLAPPGWWRTGPQALWTSLPALPLAAAAALAGLALLVGARWSGSALAIDPAALLDLATLLAGICVAVDLTMLAALSQLALPPGDGPLVALAMTASLARVAGSCLAVHRCRQGRGALAS
jgi:hypothetical protein